MLWAARPQLVNLEVDGGAVGLEDELLLVAALFEDELLDGVLELPPPKMALQALPVFENRDGIVLFLFGFDQCCHCNTINLI